MSKKRRADNMPLSAAIHMQMAYGVKLVSAFFPSCLATGGWFLSGYFHGVEIS